ncbi:MAG: hypothetical protein J6T62_05960 [Fibrobacter sp.]|nr:hypothetical protein [Fibrobacter sp.]
MTTKSLVLGSLLGMLLVLFTSTTAWAAQRVLTADGNGGYYINMPATGVDTLVIPDGVTTFKVYDDGGVSGNFSRDCDGILVLVGPENLLMRLNGTVRAEYNGWATATFSIYDAIDKANELYYASRENDIWWLSTRNSLITGFSNFYSRQPTEGLNLTVTLVDKDGPFTVEEVSVTGGNLVNPPATAAAGDVVSVTASTAAEGYVFDHIEVKDERGNSVEITGGTWLTSKTATFVMPATNAIVEPIYVTEKQGVHLHMPYEGVSRVSIPEDVESFILDGDGGEFEVSKPLVLTVPEGYLLRMEGLRSDVAYSYDYGSAYYVYDGDVPDAFESRAELITGMSLTRTVTVVFVASGEETGTMRMTLVDASQPHHIIAQSSSSGMGDIEAVNLGDEGAPVGTRVKLVARPAEGYMFSGVRARNDDNWTYLDVEIIEDSVWFTMPFADVRIIPDFASIDNPYFLVPLKGVSRKSFPEGASEISICDDGGCGGYYNDESEGVLVLTAPGENKLYAYGEIQATGWDYLEIFDGADTNANLLFRESGNDELYRTNSSTQNLTFRFNSTGWGSGFNIKVGLFDVNKKYVIDVEESDYGVISVDKEMAVIGETVTVTATPSAGHVFFGAYVYDIETDEQLLYIENKESFYGNTIQFAMPSTDVYISPNFGITNGGLAIIPANGTLNVDIPKFIKFINVHVESDDDDELYYNNSDGTLVLTAPEGYALFILYGGASLADENDSLVIYDGNDVNADKLVKIKNGEEIEGLQSTGRSLTFQFKSDGEGNSNGIYMGIALTNVSGIYSIALSDGWHGSLTSDKETAMEGDTVTITANPDQGYMLNNVSGNWMSQFDGYHYLNIIDGTWYSGNEAKFVMPAGDVEISANFDELESGYFNTWIPKSDTLRLDLLDGMKKVQVWTEMDDMGNYYNNADGLLVLTAPEGYALQVSGYARFADESDSLIIYDGANADAKRIVELNNHVNIDDVYSSGRSLTIQFKSDAEGNDYYDYGANLVVTLLPKTGSGAVAVYEYWYGKKVALIDGAYSGTDAVNIAEDIEVDNVEFNREFSTAEDGYSTLMLPFDVNTYNTDGLQTVLAFNDVIDSIVDGVKKKFVVMQALWDADTSTQNIELKANTPYLVKMWNSQLSIYGSVTLRKTENTVLTLGDWQVHGTTAYKKWQTGDPELGSVYGFAATASNGVKVGQFVKAGTGAFIRPMRAYLIYNPNNPEPKPAPANHVSVWRDNELPEEIDIVVVGDSKRAGIAGGETQPGDDRTVIGTINTRTGEIKFKRTYDLKGRPVSGTPKAKGMYIKGKR